MESFPPCHVSFDVVKRTSPGAMGKLPGTLADRHGLPGVLAALFTILPSPRRHTFPEWRRAPGPARGVRTRMPLEVALWGPRESWLFCICQSHWGGSIVLKTSGYNSSDTRMYLCRSSGGCLPEAHRSWDTVTRLKIKEMEAPWRTWELQRQLHQLL